MPEYKDCEVTSHWWRIQKVSHFNSIVWLWATTIFKHWSIQFADRGQDLLVDAQDPSLSSQNSGQVVYKTCSLLYFIYWGGGGYKPNPSLDE